MSLAKKVSFENKIEFIPMQTGRSNLLTERHRLESELNGLVNEGPQTRSRTKSEEHKVSTLKAQINQIDHQIRGLQLNTVAPPPKEPSPPPPIPPRATSVTIEDIFESENGSESTGDPSIHTFLREVENCMNEYHNCAGNLVQDIANRERTRRSEAEANMARGGHGEPRAQQSPETMGPSQNQFGTRSQPNMGNHSTPGMPDHQKTPRNSMGARPNINVRPRAAQPDLEPILEHVMQTVNRVREQVDQMRMEFNNMTQQRN